MIKVDTSQTVSVVIKLEVRKKKSIFFFVYNCYSFMFKKDWSSFDKKIFGEKKYICIYAYIQRKFQRKQVKKCPNLNNTENLICIKNGVLMLSWHQRKGILVSQSREKKKIKNWFWSEF